MSTLIQRLGLHLKKLREKKKMSQLELAQKSRLDITTVNELENGSRQPMLKTAWKLANALEVKLAELFDF